MFSPDGALGDIPYEQMHAALAAGAKPGVTVKSPDGQLGVIPADRTSEAIKAGGAIVPIHEQETDHPGFWENVKQFGSGAADTTVRPLWHLLTATPEEQKQMAKEILDSHLDQYNKAKDAFNQGYYVEAAGHALATGLPVVGPAAAKAGEDIGQGKFAYGAGEAAGLLSEPLVRRGVAEVREAAPTMEDLTDKAKNVTPKQAGQAAGATAGAVSGHGALSAPGAYYGAKTAGKVVEAVLGKDRANQPIIKPATAPAPVYPGAPLPEAPPAEVQQARPLQTGPETYHDPAAGLGEIPAAKTAQSSVAPDPQATPSPANTSPKQFEDLLTESLGGQKLQPGVALKNQPAAMRAAAGKLPEGFTPVDSSVLKGYKYDPEAQEFSAVTNNGQLYTHGDVSPDQVAAFEGAKSKGRAWTTAIRNSSPLVKKNGVPVRPVAPAEASPSAEAEVSQPESEAAEQPKAKAAAAGAGASGSDLTSLLEQSLDNVKVEKGGVHTSAAPSDLVKRWGVDENSIADTDQNVRGMSPEKSQQYIAKLADSYKQGRVVEPVMETRDADNNIISVDGRHRALAAQKAGVERIPVIVRRLPRVEVPQE